jgi:nucleoside-diphosphate-sugar epimerase
LNAPGLARLGPHGGDAGAVGTAGTGATAGTAGAGANGGAGGGGGNGANATTAVNVPLEHFYGPGDDRTKFVSSMIERLLSPERSIALTAGDQLRDFIHVDDVVEAFMRIVERCVVEARPPAPPTAGGLLTFEIGSGSPVSIRDFMLLLRRLADRPDVTLDFGALPYRPNEAMRSAADMAMMAALGWTPSVGLEDGLRRTLAAERRRRHEVQACAT